MILFIVYELMRRTKERKNKIVFKVVFKHAIEWRLVGRFLLPFIISLFGGKIILPLTNHF